jgi:hypothetical protein
MNKNNKSARQPTAKQKRILRAIKEHGELSDRGVGTKCSASGSYVGTTARKFKKRRPPKRISIRGVKMDVRNIGSQSGREYARSAKGTSCSVRRTGGSLSCINKHESTRGSITRFINVRITIVMQTNVRVKCL